MENKFYNVNGKGHLVFGGLDTVELAEKFGTPLYVIDGEKIEKNARKYLDTFKDTYPYFSVAYAGKANLCIALCQLANKLGLSLDTSSGGEIYTAKKANFPMEKIYFHGNNKTKEEINFALSNKVGRFVIDNLYEATLINKMAKEKNIKQEILLRITPGIKPKTHSFIQTGQVDSKFGIPIYGEEALNSIEKILKFNNLILKGVHCHIGSQIFTQDVFSLTIRIMIKFMDEVKVHFNYLLKELSLGGGLGIKYLPEDTPISITSFVKNISTSVKEEAKRKSFPLPKLILEPGRSIVGDAGITLYKIGSIKEIPKIRKYVCVDGGMFDNIRPSLYNARYFAVVANKAAQEPKEKVSIAGKCCESGDILIKDAELPIINHGDILAIFSTGAYNYSMSNNYNRNTRPAMVLIKEGKARLIVQRESYEDLIKNDLYLD
jgi:diaminopimelate decarboxylase